MYKICYTKTENALRNKTLKLKEEGIRKKRRIE